MKSSMIAVLLLAATALPALAGSPPVKSTKSPEQVASACGAMTSDKADLGNGCVNTRTGGAVLCTGDQCTDYFADPRYSRIKAILNANQVKPE